MSGMADTDPTDGLWNWCAAGTLDAALVRDAVSGALQRPVMTLDAPVGDAVLCDVWHVGGDFPTLIDCYMAPGDVAEATIASAVAVRLGADLLLPDDTLNPTRYVRAEPDGTLRPVHVEETETDDGTERSHVRVCTGSDPACAAGPGCSRSRWKPERPPGRPAAA
ncbi:hypothetical protein Ahu01nite_047390 [Winogradskya humida]|uniref:Uncharacterized protein n=2 Tax=Winogradskya humida TaxID=113566 RepID=A0ABQ3ZTZ9_9ACTN|nr:hypothetical protein Ahu01nite_047390 [Actinoplanes humidus]